MTLSRHDHKIAQKHGLKNFRRNTKSAAIMDLITMAAFCVFFSWVMFGPVTL